MFKGNITDTVFPASAGLHSCFDLRIKYARKNMVDELPRKTSCLRSNASIMWLNSDKTWSGMVWVEIIKNLVNRVWRHNL
jgi:hypothetical protein